MSNAAVMTDAEADAVFNDLEGDATLEGFGFDGLTDEQIDKRVTTDYPGNLPKKIAGKLVTIYDTKTGEPSSVLPYMIKKLFRDFKHEDGTPMYSRRQTVTPVRGTLLCLLHKDAPTRAHYDSVGLQGKTCRKANLRSLFDVERHMTVRHHDEYAMVQKADVLAREDEEREFRRTQMAWMREQTKSGLSEFACEECGAAFGSPAALGSHKRVHKEAS